MSDIKIASDESVPPGTMYLLSVRRTVQRILPDGTIIQDLEPIEEWGKRCCVIRNVQLPESLR
jgi:hypothetical protein